MLSMEEMEMIRRNLETLSFASGEGMILKRKRDLCDDNIIFVGLGGAGIQVLCDLKKEIRQSFREEEIESRVRFLAIDTDCYGNLKHRVENGYLEADEVFTLISNGEVRQSINPYGYAWMDNKNWANRNMYDQTSDMVEFAGIGAGAMRQVGRAHLIYTENFVKITSKLENIALQITTGKPNPNLKVFVFTCISRGTGSGTIIDFGVIARNVLRGMVAGNLSFHAFLLMPSALGAIMNPQDRIQGERNAYATLKEMDYINTLENQEIEYSVKYGTQKIVIRDRVYDFVSLIEGKSNEVNLPDYTAQKVLVKTIISMIGQNDFMVYGGGPSFLLDSIFGSTSRIAAVISTKQPSVFPRNANYIYNSLGYTECVVPVDLISAYVMRKVLEEFYRMYRQGATFIDLPKQRKIETFQFFLKNASLEERDVENGIPKQALMERVDNTIRKMMISPGMGPFFVIDFAYFLVGAAEHYLDSVIREYEERRFFGIGQARRDACRRAYTELKKYITELNETTFRIYTTVIDQLKDIVYNDADILTSTQVFRGTFSNSFSWTPISLDGQGAGHQALESFIGTRYISRVKEFATDLSADLWDHRSDWTDLQVIDAPESKNYGVTKAFREFVSGKIARQVDEDQELFLTIAYSGNPDAVVTETDGSPSKDLIDAVKAMYKDIELNSKPLVRYLNSEYTDVYSLRYIAIPQSWRYISWVLFDKDTYQIVPFGVQVYHTDANDRISAFQINHGLAPFMLQSVVDELQASYETDPHSVGLHLVQTAEEDWADLPNLNVIDRLPIKLEKDGWKTIDGDDVNFADYRDVSARECGMIQDLYIKIDYLKERGFIVKNKDGYYPYDVYVVKHGVSIDQCIQLLKSKDHITYEELLKEPLFRKIPIRFYGMSMDLPGVPLGSPLDEDAKWNFSKQIIYRNMRIRKCVEQTYEIVKALQNMIEA